MNPSTVLEFSKLLKFIVKIVIFHCRSGTTKNDQLLCGHFQFKCQNVNKLVIYLGHFQFSSYPMTTLVIYHSHFQFGSYHMTRLDIYLGHFQLAHLKFLNFGHLSLQKKCCDHIFWSPGHCSLILYQCQGLGPWGEFRVG